MRTRARALPMCFATRCESASPCSGQNHGADASSPDLLGPRVDVARVLDDAALPELAEREGVCVRDLARLDRHDDVLLARPGVVGPVRRAGPDRLAVADDELVVHKVGNPRDAARRDRERLDRLRHGLRRGRDDDRRGVGDVVEKPDGDAALRCGEERREDERARVRLEADVVERNVERRARLREEAGDLARDVRGALASVGQRRDPDRRVRGRAGRHPVAAAERSAALCARLAAWYSASASGESTPPRHG